MLSKVAFFVFNVMCYCTSNSNQASLRSSVKNFRQEPSTAHLTLAEWPSYNLFEPNGPGTYAFGYEIEDAKTQNIQFRDEEKLQNGTVRGSYGTVRPNGLVSLTQYIADEKGYRAETQTFGSTNVNPILLTSTQSPIVVPASPHDVDYLDITISPEIAQQIIDKDKEISSRPNTSSYTNSMKGSDSSAQNLKPQTSIDRQDTVYEVYEDNDDDDENDLEQHEENSNSNMKPGYSTINAAINQQYPIKFITKDNQTFGIQLVNNFIPHNFQIIPFSLPKQSIKKKKKPSISEANRPEIAHDEINEEPEQQVNDKFFDPVFDGKLIRKIKDNNNKRNLSKRKSSSSQRNNFNYDVYRIEHSNLLKKYGLI